MASYSMSHWLIVLTILAVLAVPGLLLWLIIRALVRTPLTSDTKKRGRLALLALLVFSVPAAMRGWHSLGQSAQALDPCSLLTSQEVAAAIEAPSLVAQRLDEKQCYYHTPENIKPGQWNQIIVEAALNGADLAFTKPSISAGLFRANGLTDVAPGATSPAPLVGDASTFWVMGNLFSARRGDAYVTIDMRGMAAKQSVVGPMLAAKVLDRMR